MRNSKAKKKEIKEEKAVVTFGLGATLNAGDYESVKIHFSLSMECPLSEVQKTIKKVKSEVKKQMQIEISEAKGLLGER